MGGNKGDYFVFLNDNGTARKQKITIGETSKNNIEVTSGIKSGDQVICSNTSTLQDGDAINAVAEQDNDAAKQKIEQGMSREDAIKEAGLIRLRPIVMTTLAMIFGMIPLAVSKGMGSEMRAPMAQAVIGGLITSTILTLFVVPIMYTILDDLKRKFIKIRFKKSSKVDVESNLNL